MGDVEVTEDFFIYSYKSAENSSTILPRAIEYLVENVGEEIAKVFEDPVALKALYFIGKMTTYETDFFDFKVFESEAFDKFLGALMLYS
jgi:hypothetical protein